MSADATSCRLRQLLAAALLVAGPVASASAATAMPAAEPRPLVLERLGAGWREVLAAPTLARLRSGMGITVVERDAAEIQSALDDAPTALALTRRSTIASDIGLAGRGRAQVELGPATCFVIASAPEKPWRAYADLNYGASELRVDASSPETLRALRRLLTVLPVAPPVEASYAPLRLGLQRLAASEADIVAIEVSRLGADTLPAAEIETLEKRGLRLLALPTHIEPQVGGFVAAELMLRQATLPWDKPVTYATYCDPLVLTVAEEDVQQMVELLFPAQRGIEPAAGPAYGVIGGFVADLSSALSSLMAMLRAQ